MTLILGPLSTTVTPRLREETRLNLVELRAALESAQRLLPTAEATSCEIELRNFLRRGMVHFLSFFLIEPDGHGNPGYVVLEVNADYTVHSLFEILATTAPSVVSSLFKHCDKFDANQTTKRCARQLRGWAVYPNASYIAFPGHSVERIRAEADLRQCIRHQVSTLPDDLGTATGLWAKLQEKLADLMLPAVSVRPFLVRWSPRLGGLRKRLGLLARRSLAAILVSAAGCSLYSIASHHSVRAALGAMVLSMVAGAALPGFLWLKESPKRLSMGGRLLIAKSAAGKILHAALLFSVSLFAVLQLLSLYPFVTVAALGALGVVVLLFFGGWLYVAGGPRSAVSAHALLTCAWLAVVAFFSERPLMLLVLSAILVGVLTALVLLWLVSWLNAVRTIELEEAEAYDPVSITWDLNHLDRVQAHEDERPQNHLATLSRIKPNRLYTLSTVLRAVHLLSKVYFNRADLAGIRTIHFASFTILPDRKRLLFLGNYDGAFGAYLQEFNSVAGVTAVWSNTQGFPRSFFLIGDGATDEQRFKAFARRDQLATLGWYSAYPELSISDIENGSSTLVDFRRRFARTPSLLTSLCEPGLTEADCDAALRRL